MCKTYATPKINTIATCLRKQVKHLKHTLATCVYNHCNICNIDVKHLQHTSEISKTLKTYGCNMRFSTQCHLASWTNGGSSLRNGAEVGGGAWSSPVPHRRHRAPLGEHGGLGENLCEAARALASSAAYSASTLVSTPCCARTPGSTPSEHHLLGK